ncbi:MAG: hypothetical protein AABW85_00030 [archaeon]
MKKLFLLVAVAVALAGCVEITPKGNGPDTNQSPPPQLPIDLNDLFDANQPVDQNQPVVLPLNFFTAIEAGSSDLNNFSVCNNSAQAISNIIFSKTGEIAGWITPEPIPAIASLGAGQCQQENFTITVADSQAAGNFAGSITATSGTNSGTINISVQVMPQPPQVIDCSTLENQTKIDQCILNQAVTGKNFAKCNELIVLDKDECRKTVALLSKQLADCLLIQKKPLRNTCLNTIGADNKDIAFCNEIVDDEDLKKSCSGIVYGAVPQASNCTGIEDIVKREDCLFLEAGTKSDYKICTVISGSIRQGIYYRDTCLDRFESTFPVISACSFYINKDLQQVCLFDFGVRANSSEACSALIDQQKVNECFKSIAIGANDQVKCNNVSDKAMREECFEYFAKNSPTLDNCANVADPYVQKECYMNAGIAAMDDKICDKIGDWASDLQTNCYSQIGKSTNNPNVCDKIYPYNFGQRDGCFKAVAQSKTDYTICEYIHFPENYIPCFSSIAITAGSFGICDQMAQDYFTGLGYNPKFGCYKDYAIAKHDKAICELIGPADIQAACKAGA